VLPRIFDDIIPFGFIETENSKNLTKSLDFLVENTPTNNMRGLEFCVVRGLMGCGKTTTVWKSIRIVCAKYK
jgi:ABC-type proline/glycine betaine transport system ATPase subunit